MLNLLISSISRNMSQKLQQISISNQQTE